jgi:hypothetical protein
LPYWSEPTSSPRSQVSNRVPSVVIDGFRRARGLLHRYELAVKLCRQRALVRNIPSRFH